MAKIMLVEDDNNLREIYEARLLAEGYEIISAADGEEALAIAVKEKPDLIISDVMMPKISGFDMLDILRGTPETRNTKVIMMTALSQSEDKSRAESLGADRYLVKSQVTLEDVARVAREVLEGEAGGSDETSEETIPPTTVATEAPAQPVVAPPALDDGTNDNTQAIDQNPVTPTVQPQPLATPPASDIPQSQTLPAEPQTTNQPPVAPEPPVAPIPSPATTQPDETTSTPEPQIEAPAEPQTTTQQPPTSDDAQASLNAVESEINANPEITSTEQVPPPATNTDQQVSSPIENAQTVETEQNVVNDQIESFVNNVPVEAPSIEVSEDGTITSSPPQPEPVAAPAVPSEPVQPVEQASIEAPTPEPQATTPTPEPEPNPLDSTPTQAENPSKLKKVIQPLSDPNQRPDLNALLEKQHEADQLQDALKSAGVPPAPDNGAIVGQMDQPAQTTAKQPAQSQEGDNKDPNLIAL